MEVKKNAAILALAFLKLFGDCASSPADTEALVDNATGYADRYGLGAGFRRCASRVGVPNARAAWFARDVPDSIASPTWRLYEAFCAAKLPRSHRAQSRRFAESMPRSESLRGTLFNEGFGYQYAARAAALVFLSASVWLAPTACYSNRVMMTEVLTRAIEARDHMLATGPANKMAEWEVRKRQPAAGLGAFLFGFSRKRPRPREMMLQVRLGGTAPGVGGSHFAFPSDCFPRATSDRTFVTDDEVSEPDREALCSTLVRERKNFEGAVMRGGTSGYALWAPGCPVRVSLDGVGGNRLSLLPPEPASWELRSEVTSNHRNVQLAWMAAADELKSATESSTQRAKAVGRR